MVSREKKPYRYKSNQITTTRNWGSGGRPGRSRCWPRQGAPGAAAAPAPGAGSPPGEGGCPEPFFPTPRGRRGQASGGPQGCGLDQPGLFTGTKGGGDPPQTPSPSVAWVLSLRSTKGRGGYCITMTANLLLLIQTEASFPGASPGPPSASPGGWPLLELLPLVLQLLLQQPPLLLRSLLLLLVPRRPPRKRQPVCEKLLIGKNPHRKGGKGGKEGKSTDDLMKKNLYTKKKLIKKIRLNHGGIKNPPEGGNSETPLLKGGKTHAHAQGGSPGRRGEGVIKSEIFQRNDDDCNQNNEAF